MLPINFCGGPNEIVAQLKQCRAQSAPIDVDEDALPDQSAGQQGSASRRPPEDSNRREIIEPAWKFSALAESQMQAMQGAVFFYLPSMLLSGFMFPFQGMPSWARAIGEVLPLTHFVRAARGVLLKGEGGVLVGHEMWPVALFAFAAAALALVAYRRRLD